MKTSEAIIARWQARHERFRGKPPSNCGWKAGSFELSDKYAVRLPHSYRCFMEVFGPGTLSGFLHFSPPYYLNTYGYRMSPFTNELEPRALDDSGEVLIFANSDNGDFCGWRLSDLTSDAPAVVGILPRSFDTYPVARDFDQFFESLLSGNDLFGIGPMVLEYKPMEPY